MPIEGWRSLLETQWGDCVILHNLLFSFGIVEVHEAPIPPKKSVVSKSSVYELQKSAAHWNWHDFKELSNR